MRTLLGLLCTVLILLGTGGLARGQASFAPGYVVDNSGDTLRGFVNEKSFRLSNKEVEFKSSEMEKSVKVYLPNQLSGYGVEPGKRYRSMVLQNGQRSFSQPEGKEILHDTVFAAVVVAGDIDIVSYKDNQGYLHVYYEREGAICEVVESVPAAFQDGGKQFQTWDAFQSLFADCDATKNKTTDAPMSPQSLQRLLSLYSKCDPEHQNDFMFEFDRISVRPMVLLGGNFASCKFSWVGNHPLDGVKLNYRPGFNVGLGVEIGSSAQYARWSLVVNALLQSFRADGSKEGYQQGLTFVNNYEWKMWGHSVKIPVLLRFRLPYRRFQPYFQLGGSFGTWLDVDITQRQETVYPQGNNEPFTESIWTDPDDIRKLEQSLIGGVGIARGNFSLEVRYERGNGFLWPVGWNSTTQSFQLLTGVRF